jgi:hypothetical protein
MLSLFVEPTIVGVNLVTARNQQKFKQLWRSYKCCFTSNDSVPSNISLTATEKKKFCLKILVTTTDLFRNCFVEDFCFRTAVLDGIVCGYFQIRVNNYTKFASSNSTSIIKPI